MNHSFNELYEMAKDAKSKSQEDFGSDRQVEALSSFIEACSSFDRDFEGFSREEIDAQVDEMIQQMERKSPLWWVLGYKDHEDMQIDVQSGGRW